MKHAIIVLILAACAFVGFGGLQACTRPLPAKTVRTAEIYACRVAVVAEYSGDVLDAGEVVRQVIMGQTSLPNVLLGLGATVPEVKAAVVKFLVCDPDMPAPGAAALPPGLVEA